MHRQVEAEFQTMHLAFPQPEDRSAVLWRYMDAEKFESMLNCSRLFMPNALNLGDILEGSAPEGVMASWKRQAEKAENDEARQITEHNSEFMTRMATMLRDNYYVTCWHMNPNENALMWRSYTKNDTTDSVAIKTTFDCLKNQLPEYANIGMVRYIDYSKNNFPSNNLSQHINLFQYITHKDLLYISENEVRGVVAPPIAKELGQDHFESHLFEKEKEDGSTLRVYAPPIDLVALIQGIVLNPNATDQYTDKVKNLCSAHGLPVPEVSRQKRQPKI